MVTKFGTVTKMGNLFHYIKGIKNGESFFDEQFKFSFILREVSVVHFLFAVLFLIAGNKIIGIYNVAIFVGYLLLSYLIKAKKYRTVLFLTSVEVMAHGALATILVGSGTGFLLFYLAIIPGIFYMVLTWNVFKKKIALSIAYTVFFGVSMAAMLVISFFVKPLTPLNTAWNITFIVINVFISVFCIAEFMILIDWDVMYRNEKMASINTELDTQANMDPLTKLYNRRFMNQKLEEKLVELSKQGNIFGIIMGDIDNFKRVNDTYGHDIGDKVLQEVAVVLKQSTRDKDYVCRWGGEEFLIIINGNKKITVEVAERMRAAISDIKIPVGSDILQITMTFGVTDSIPGFDADKLVGIADANLYQGKTTGKNKVVVTPDINI